LRVQHPDYVCRVTADEGDIGRGHLSRFQDVDTESPVILTTSQLLTTGVDAPTCKNVVLARLVGSMSEFKQIIGRGTRVRDDYDKLWFNIIDYTGSATRLFADPAFDGEPVRITEEEINSQGDPVNVTETEILPEACAPFRQHSQYSERHEVASHSDQVHRPSAQLPRPDHHHNRIFGAPPSGGSIISGLPSPGCAARR
jgi:type I restriction enzyme R subunit